KRLRESGESRNYFLTGTHTNSATPSRPRPGNGSASKRHRRYWVTSKWPRQRSTPRRTWPWPSKSSRPLADERGASLSAVARTTVRRLESVLVEMLPKEGQTGEALVDFWDEGEALSFANSFDVSLGGLRHQAVAAKKPNAIRIALIDFEKKVFE